MGKENVLLCFRDGEPGWVWDEFEETVPMSSYIVAFALTDFVFKKSKGQPLFRTWARKDAIDQVRINDTRRSSLVLSP